MAMRGSSTSDMGISDEPAEADSSRNAGETKNDIAEQNISMTRFSNQPAHHSSIPSSNSMDQTQGIPFISNTGLDLQSLSGFSAGERRALPLLQNALGMDLGSSALLPVSNAAALEAASDPGSALGSLLRRQIISNQRAMSTQSPTTSTQAPQISQTGIGLPVFSTSTASNPFSIETIFQLLQARNLSASPVAHSPVSLSHQAMAQEQPMQHIIQQLLLQLHGSRTGSSLSPLVGDLLSSLVQYQNFPPGWAASPSLQHQPDPTSRQLAASILNSPFRYGGPTTLQTGLYAQVPPNPAPPAGLQQISGPNEPSSLDESISESSLRNAGRKRARRKRNDSENTSGEEHDRSEGINPPKRKKRAYNHEQFPLKVHRIIRETAEAGKAHIISFSQDGTEFSVHKPKEFEDKILPKYFRHNQLSSFRRLLNLYGFLRLQEGAEGGTFRHPSFLRDHPELCKDIERMR